MGEKIEKVEKSEKHVRDYIDEIEQRARTQCENQSLIRNSTPLSEDQLGKLDSTLKRATAFMKKLKNIGAGQQTTIFNDLEKINLSKFVEEIAISLAEIKIKMNDVNVLVQICVRISCLYSNFSSLLFAEFKKFVPTKRTDKIVNPSKLRVDLRVIAELCLHGVFAKEGIQLLGSMISYLTVTDKADHNNVAILLPLCKSLGVDLLGLHSLSIQKEATEFGIDLPMPSTITVEQKHVFAQLFLDYRKTLVDHIQKELNEMNHILRSIKKQTRSRGDASSEDRVKLDEVRTRYEKHLQNGLTLSEVLGVELEQMVEEQSEDEDEEKSALEIRRALQEGILSIWPDEDTRQFYEMRLQLREMVPAILFQESELRTLEPVQGAIEDVDLTGLEDIPECDEEAIDEDEPSDSNDGEMEAREPMDIDATIASLLDPAVKYSGKDLKKMMTTFLDKLPWLINRDLIDNAALEFVTDLNTKINRKKLCQVMLNEHLDRLDLLPFYGRLIATLEPVMPDFAVEMSQALIQEFKSVVQNKSKCRLDRKIRLCRFISELVKFGLIPKAEAIVCLRMVLFDFRGHNIDMCCAMIDSMGPFLYLSSDSHSKTKILLDVMMKKREKINDPRQQMLIDNAYFACIPPPQEEKIVFTRPTMLDFIRTQIISINANRMEHTVRLLRKIDWTDVKLVDFVIRCLSTPSLVRFTNVPQLASLVAALSSFHDFIKIRVLDNVLEELRLALEFNHPSLNQTAVLAVVYLGQLYNYTVCDSPIIFKTLYHLITFGAFDPFLDDWNNFMRIGLVCDLLMTCGEFFNGSAAKRRLDCFLIYFYRYVWAKKDACALRDLSFPSEVQFRLEEMLNYVRKSAKMPKSMKEAQEAVEEIENKYKEMVEAPRNDENGGEEEDYTDEDDRTSDLEIRRKFDQTEDDAQSSGEEVSTTATFFDDGENVVVHTNQVVLPEDEEFVQNYEKIIAETMQSRATTAITPLVEITVPTSARQKFHRTIAFEDSNRPINNNVDGDRSTRMAILTRGKGNKTILKAIRMETPDGLAETWQAEREKERKEFDEHKHITLSMNERMMADDNCSD